MLNIETHYTKDDTFDFVYSVSVNGHLVPGKYVTKQMAIANALCYLEFHMSDMNEEMNFDIEDTDMIESSERRNGIPRQNWTPEEFSQFIAGYMERFPEAQIQVTTEWQHKKTTNGDFYIISKRDASDIRERAFIVRKNRR